MYATFVKAVKAHREACRACASWAPPVLLAERSIEYQPTAATDLGKSLHAFSEAKEMVMLVGSPAVRFAALKVSNAVIALGEHGIDQSTFDERARSEIEAEVEFSTAAREELLPPTATGT